MASTIPQSKYRRMRLLQEDKQWDIETDVPWDSLDVALPLLDCGQVLRQTLNLSSTEELAVSRLLGLMAAQAIGEHERVLSVVKTSCWREPLTRLSASDDLLELGEQFFKEEAKHALAFARYIDRFAHAMRIDRKALASILPMFAASSIITKLFRLNSFFGGRAVWWLVMITEEESLALFRRIRGRQANTEPLFYELNRQHFVEEIRHMSYAPLMLRTLSAKASPSQREFIKFDFFTTHVLYVFWLFAQFRRLRTLRKLKATHPFFEALYSVMRKYYGLPLAKRVEILLHGIPGASDSLNPARHAAIKIEIKRNLEKATGWVYGCLGLSLQVLRRARS